VCQEADDTLTTAQAKDLLAQLKHAGCPVVLFSGGEPLLREDIFEVLAEARRLGLRTVISTNGTLIDATMAKRLKELEVGYVGISIDGPEAFHDAFRQVPGCFDAALQGMQQCRSAGLKTGLRFTMTRDNIRHVPFVFDLAVSQNVRRICFYHLIRTGRAVCLHEESPGIDQTRQALDVIIEQTQQHVQAGQIDEVLTVDNHADGPYLLLRMQQEGHSRVDQATQLLAHAGGSRVGTGIMSVGWDGQVYADQFWREYPLGNVTQRTFAEIWHRNNDPVLMKIRAKDTWAHPRCRSCKWFSLCKGNYRFLGPDPGQEHWINEPACYLTDQEIAD
jgi:radical SAM protein with 4Fe4S-binding SPASM domain